MNKPAAISAQLVDVRNIGTHKCVKLTLHVPAEQAGIVLAAFGWPTDVNPVPVAVARLSESDGASSPREADVDSWDGNNTASRPRSAAWQAGYLCTHKQFQRFLYEQNYVTKPDEEEAARAVRALCGVKSRSDIDGNSTALKEWRDLKADFDIWERAVL